MIKINKSQSRGTIQLLNADSLCRVRKLTFPEVVKENHAIAHRHRQVWQSITVIVANCTGHAVTACREPGLRRWNLFEPAATEIPVCVNRLLPFAHHDQVFVSRALDIEDASPSAQLFF